MNFESWLGFALASFLVAIIPGPGVASIVGFAVSSGRKVALASVVGMAIGNALAVSLSLAGAAAILAASAFGFMILKWIGAIYLIAIGILAIIRSGPASSASRGTPSVSSRAALVTNVVVGTLHPKTIVFFAAFSAQFITADMPYLQQAAALVATFTLIAATTDTIYALSASRAARLLRDDRARRWSQRFGGGVLVSAGVAMAAIRR